jgi:hypothetical protein
MTTKKPKPTKINMELKNYVDDKVDKLSTRIDIIDQRDATQFSIAKTHIAEYDVFLNNQAQLKANFDILAERQARMIDDLVPEFREGINRIHTLVDTHIQDENIKFQEVREDLREAASHVKSIQNTLDNVSANGNKGLSASLTDMYNKLSEVQKITEGARSRRKLVNVFKSVVENTAILRPLKSKIGIAIYTVIAILILNSVLHPFGIGFSIEALFVWIIKLLAA